VCDKDGCRPFNEGNDDWFSPMYPTNSTIGDVFLVSDNTASTVKNAFSKCLNQFETFFEEGSDSDGDLMSSIFVRTRVFTFIRTEEKLTAIIRKADERKTMIMTTFAETSLREKARRMGELSDVPIIDILGPSIDSLSSFFKVKPLGVPASTDGVTRRVPPLGDAYFRRIEAVEFTLKADDGQAPWLLPAADVVIVGVSRTGKTPLSIVTSQMLSLRVANVPLVCECPLPSELSDASLVDPDRVFCLKISPVELKKIRQTRLERTADTGGKGEILMTESNYADRSYVLKDLRSARDLANKYGWTEIDVTGRAVEETASYIGEIMNERFGQPFMC